MFTGNLLSARVFVSMVATAVLTVSQVIGREDKVEENYRAFAVNMSSLGPNTSTVVDLHITRWSTEAEREALPATLMEKGQEAFVEALRKQKETGWVRAQGRAAARTAFPSVRLHYAFQFDEGDARKIVLITDRPIGLAEVARNSRSLEYNISGIVLEMPTTEGQDGTGQLVVGMRPSTTRRTRGSRSRSVPPSRCA